MAETQETNPSQSPVESPSGQASSSDQPKSASQGPKAIFAILVILALVVLVAVVIWGQVKMREKAKQSAPGTDYMQVLKSSPIPAPREGTSAPSSQTKSSANPATSPSGSGQATKSAK